MMVDSGSQTGMMPRSAQTERTGDLTIRPTKLELMMNPKLKELVDADGQYIEPLHSYTPIKTPTSPTAAPVAFTENSENPVPPPVRKSPKRFLPHNLRGHLQFVQEEKAMAAAPVGPIEASKFIQYVTERKKKKILLRGEFLLIRKSVEEGEQEVGQSKENNDKNQYAEIIPYDRNRVILNLEPGDANSDYINASYVDSFYEQQAYVITQAVRTKSAMTDFWRLVWESETNCIVMLTKVFDFMRVMCLQYWPMQDMIYGNIEVETLEVKTYAHFIMRRLKLSKVNKDGVGAPREVTQFHFIEWELDAFPYISAFLELRRRVRKYLKENPSVGPVIVHCSNGGARSGTFCAVDANLEMLEREKVADIFGFCKQLINARSHTVETLEQYQFIYEVIVEWMQCKVEPIQLHELQTKSSLYKNKKNREEQETQDSHEYKLLCQLTPGVRIGDCAGGHRLENRGKNRDVMVVPPDNSRPYLQTLHGESKDYTYINAVYVDGFTRKSEWIVTEWPKQHTLDSLWALVFDHSAHTLVNLTSGGSTKVHTEFLFSHECHLEESPKVVASGDDMDGSWSSKGRGKRRKSVLPAENAIDQLTFMISEIMSSGGNAVQEAETRVCCILTVKMWPIDYKVPLSTSGLLDLIKMARSWKKRAPDRPETKPTIVLSHNGRSRAGIYIAANVCIEQMEMDGEVDVFHAVKMIRINRPQLVDTKDEYKYLYDLMLHWYMTNPDYREHRMLQHPSSTTQPSHQAG